MQFEIPTTLAENCRKSPDRTKWLDRLPDTVCDVGRRWSLTLDPPFDGEDVSAAFVAPTTLTDGTAAVLKIGMPHMEAHHEADGLRFWDGNPTIRLLRHDPGTGAMLLERCTPGTSLRKLPEPEQDEIIAGLLRRLLRTPPTFHPFRPLSILIEHWSAETLASEERWTEPALVREGLCIFHSLLRNATTDALLATDLHAGNVLRSERQPWLVIDPKPFIGDPAYDATQHLFNCPARLSADPLATIRRLADLAGLDPERVRLWTFARAAAEPRDDWASGNALAIALKP
jgi:streptomycin 6-kinase